VNKSKTKVVVFGAQLQKARQMGTLDYIDGGGIKTPGLYTNTSEWRCPTRAG
jgi:hypothetical protein